MLLVVTWLGACMGVSSLKPFAEPAAEDSAPLPRGDTAVERQGDAPGAGFPFEDGKIFDLALTLPPDSVENLDYMGDYVVGTLSFAGYESEVGVRLKGAGTYDTLDGKPALKFNFGAFTPGARFLGVERLTLNSMRYDTTKLREAVAYRMYEQMGVPSPRHGFGHLTINGEDYGLYSLVETLDENFLKRAYPDDDDGNLFDSTLIFADLTSAGLPSFELQEGDPASGYTDLQALVAELDAGPFYEVLERRFDVDATLAFLAIDLASPNWDGYSRNTNNFLLYHATVADRWFVVPWGQDAAFYGGGLLYEGVKARLAAGCVNDAVCRPLLEQRVRDVLHVWETEDLYGWTEAAIELVGPACEADPRKSGDCEQAEMLELLAGRPEELLREIGP